MQMDHLDYSLMAEDGPTSLRYHYFGNSWAGIGPNYLQQRVSELEQVGYYSVLLPYNNQLPDNFITASRALDVSEKIKYNIAIRTGDISPEHCAMMASAFSQINKNRLMLNLLHGSPHPAEGKDSLLKNREDLKRHTYDFAKALSQSKIFNKTNTEIIIAGDSPETFKAVLDYGDYGAIDLINFTRADPYSNNGKAELAAYRELPRLMLSVDIVVVENDEEAENFLHKFSAPNAIVGNEKTIIDRLASLEAAGVTDILVSNHELDKNPKRVHNLIKKLV